METENYINEIPKFTKKNKLEHTAAFLKRMGNPQNSMKIIHVAGTNGKGSVCNYLSHILCCCKKTTGLFVSPHLQNLTERISVDNQNVSRNEFRRSFVRIKMLVDEMKQEGYPHPSYFEYLFLMAIDVFAERKVEYAVIETGLGGRLDATNVIESPVLTIITSIGKDHTEWLGDTLEEIAFEKAGIIKPGVPVIYQGEQPQAAEVIRKRANERKTKSVSCTHKDYKILKKEKNHIDFLPLCGYYLNTLFTIPFFAEYQVENAMLALLAVEQLDEIRKEVSHIKEGIAQGKFAGRMEEVKPQIFLDGAHNEAGMDAFVKAAAGYPCKGKKYLLFSAMQDKDYKYMIEKICKEIKPDKVFITELQGERGLPADKISKEFGKTDKFVSNNIEEVFSCALKEKGREDVLFCTGSLYLIGELKKLL